MKLKDILSEIKEEWLSGTTATIKGKYREIFINPTSGELRDIKEFGGVREGDNLRFIAMKGSQDVYASSADVFHRTIVEEIDGLVQEDIWENFSGIGNVDRNGMVNITGFSDFILKDKNYLYDVCTDIVNGEYDWLALHNFDMSYIFTRAENKRKRLMRVVL